MDKYLMRSLKYIAYTMLTIVLRALYSKLWKKSALGFYFHALGNTSIFMYFWGKINHIHTGKSII